MLPSKRFLAAFIVKQGLFKLAQNVIRDVDCLQHLTEAFAHLFFAEIGQIAFASIARAAVVRILLLLEFGGHGAVVIGATEQPGECEIMLLLSGPSFAAQYFVGTREQFRTHKGSMRALIVLAFPFVGSDVEGFLISFSKCHFEKTLPYSVLKDSRKPASE